MKKKNKKLFWIGSGFLTAFVVWTLMVLFVDVAAIGPQKSRVGFSHFNELVHTLTGVNRMLYTITDWLGLIPIAVASGFAGLGLAQWIKRKSIFKVDRDILTLGGIYLIVMGVYLLFEMVVINYRPVLIEGILEASYPSSTTMLAACVIPTAMIQLKKRIKSNTLRCMAYIAMTAFTAFMVVGRLFSGVHWITDIIGGALFSIGMVILYHAVLTKTKPN